MNIYLDMDGTIADLYGVENWLEKLLAEDATPFTEAKPLLDMHLLSDVLNNLQERGWNVGVITWCPLGASRNFKLKVRRAKQRWLDHHLPELIFDNFHVISYGTPKSKYNAFGEAAVLFDDNAEVLEQWNGIAELVINPEHMLKTLNNYLVFQNLESIRE